jgi:hypothetical protein
MNGNQHLEVVLACFSGHKRAGQVHRTLTGNLEADRMKILDEVVYSVTPKGKARGYDPRRTLRGAATPALIWGLFGLVASGGSWQSLLIWAVIGAFGGVLYTYYSGHLETKDQLAHLGTQLPLDSSAILAYVVDTNAATITDALAQFQPALTSVATISGDLSATVRGGTSDAPRRDTLGAMLVFRYPGQGTAKRVYADASAKSKLVETELLVNADQQGGLHVASPSLPALVRSDVSGWGVLGLIYGAAVGYAGSGGLFGALERSVVTGVVWALTGALAGTLYGLYAGRAVSARRLTAFGPLLAPDTSMVLAWTEEAPTRETTEPWMTAESEHLALLFNKASHGAILEV